MKLVHIITLTFHEMPTTMVIAHSSICLVLSISTRTNAMKTFIENPKRDQTGLKKKRREATSKEWDLGINLTVDKEYASLMAIQGYLDAQCCKPDTIIEYALISGIEYTDQTKKDDNTTKGNPHVHIALIVKTEINKAQVLSLIRPVKMGPKEYACPRGQGKSYYGWKMHHLKRMTKVNPQQVMTYEFGTLPIDKWNSKLIKYTNGVVNKHGDDKEKEAWAEYRKSIRMDMTDIKKKERDQFKAMEDAKLKYERACMVLEDTWEQERQLQAEGKLDPEAEAMLQTIEDQKRKKARKTYFVNQARKRKRQGNH